LKAITSLLEILLEILNKAMRGLEDSAQ